MSFHVETEQKNSVLCVRLQGELDHHTASAVRDKVDEALANPQIKHILLNAEGLTFMDSSGIGVILGRYKKLQARGGELVICTVSSSVYRLLEMAGLFKVLRLEEGEDHALRTLGEAV
ncbi:stage II sporulation protein AA (anti-sigma F factor antagonist) [Geomicrobium halophilum]|uniref:Anti-sigma F factor antagonist n=1 Tax=Geomicrobium halophilum TaxID=549000 RepID=A0A841PMM0_9BACL|nr:anti-sigma F factor antagonist [Geomicrobium halophilum]MBB6448974.1 stage II sporulation protein AA (anti-sigma F factor antagonist) [Geomicrobium halophilum]